MKSLRKGILFILALLVMLCPTAAFSEEMAPIELVWSMEELIEYFYYDEVDAADIFGGGFERVRSEHKDRVNEILDKALKEGGQVQSVEEYLAREDLEKEAIYFDMLSMLLEEDPSLLDSILHGLYDNLDDYSTYFNQEEMTRFNENVTGDFVGIGVGIMQSGSYLTVSRVLKDSPAEQAGLMPGDRIYRIDGKKAVGMDSEIAVSYLRGEEGTTVLVEVLREGNIQALPFEITRAPIETSSVDYELYDTYAYIQIGDFNSHTSEALGEAMAEIHEQNIDRVIIDLRDNLGGIMEEAQKALGYFIPRNSLAGIMRYSGGSEEELLVKGESAVKPLKTVILINENSASASEFFAGAMKDYDAAVLVGQTTYGKGCAQQIFPLVTEGGAKLTISHFFTPKDKVIEDVGIAPTITIENTTEPLGTEGFEPFDLSHTVKVGEAHPNVLALKERMRILGFHLSDVSEVYDEKTSKEVAFVQKALRMETQDGTLNEVTMEQFDRTAGNTQVLVDKQLDFAISYVTAGDSVKVLESQAE